MSQHWPRGDHRLREVTNYLISLFWKRKRDELELEENTKIFKDALTAKLNQRFDKSNIDSVINEENKKKKIPQLRIDQPII